ncbi:MAG: methyltransferase domain-containing protein [Acidobacteria bacterium]|nr:methyltransferase domain-containing protein [Acidobacteriota bacterium]
MKPRLLAFLMCPWCRADLAVIPFDLSAPGDEVQEGLLQCVCGRRWPIVNGIPRILEDAFELFPDFVERHRGRLPALAGAAVMRAGEAEAIRRTRESFGFQWTQFSEMVIDFRENFLKYIEPLDQSFFPGKVGLDLGCGFGRHIYNAAKFGAEMIGVDLSDAIESTRANTRGMPNVHLVQADVFHLPIRHGVLDFAYSIGVLHHTPDPEAAFRCLVPLVKPGGSVFVWVYSKTRSFLNFCLEAVRRVTTRLPPRVQKAVSLGAAVVDYGGFVLPYRIAASIPGLGAMVAKLPLTARLALYSVYPFQVVYADWFDRLAAPIRFYYDGEDMKGWLSRASLSGQRVSPTGLFGWRAYGERA